jgi:integrase
MKLTKTTVETAQPKAKNYRISDAIVPGLCLMVMPSGHKSYYLRHRTADGRQRELKLGTPVELTPDMARSLARDALAQVREGRDPGAERRKFREAPTIQELAVRYMEEHGNRKKSSREDETLWRLHLLPKLGRLKVATLSKEQVRNFHTSHPRPVRANRALEVLSRAMKLAEEWEWREAGSNPCAGIRSHPEQIRERYLEEEELVRLRATLMAWERDAHPAELRWRFCQMIRLLLLTGARLREIMHARWEWVNWERWQLAIPVENHKTGRKTGRKRIIHLSERALEILEGLRENRLAASPWVIGGSDPGKPLGGYRKLWLRMLADAQIEEFRLHDLRHSFASYSLGRGQTLGVVGQLLGHQSTQTTLRYAHLIDADARHAVGQISEAVSI